MQSIIPRSLLTFPTLKIGSLWDDFLEETRLDTIPSGLSISEDDKGFYIDAALPGIDPEKIEVTFDRGILHVEGQATEEEQKKRFYRKATSQFSYNIATPESIDSKKEPKMTYSQGMMHAVFEKSAALPPKRIEVKVA